MVLSTEDGFDTTRIPDGVWLKVFSKLPYQDYCQIRLTCKHFAYLSTARRLKNFKLKLDGEESVQQLRAYIEENHGKTLPVSTLALHNLNNSDDLGYILKALSKEIRVLYLVDALVFASLHDARLIFLEELYLHFDQSAWDLDVFWDIKCYKRLHTIDFALRHDFNVLYRSMLAQFIEAAETIRLKHITLSYNKNNDEQMLAFLRLHACYLKSFSMFCRTGATLGFQAKLCELFASMKHLERLFLSGNCTNDWAKSIFNSLPQKASLSSIGFEFTVFDCDEILKLVVSKWTNTLANIKLISNRALTRNGIKEISKLHDKLESLEIQYEPNVTLMDVANAVASKNNRKLRKLNCNCLGRMCDESVNKLATNLLNLEELELSDLRVHLTNRSLEHVFEKLKGLRKLRISCSSENFPQISQLTHLEELNLNFCQGLTSAVARDLVFPNLRKLNLSSCKNITSEGFIQIAQNCPALEVLELKECNALDDEAVYFICRNLTKLHKLNIKQCDNVSNKAVFFAIYMSGIRRVDYKYDEFDGMYYWLQ